MSTETNPVSGRVDYGPPPPCEVCGKAGGGFLDLYGSGYHGPITLVDSIFDQPTPQQPVVGRIVLCPSHYEHALDGICDATGGSSGTSAWMGDRSCADPFHGDGLGHEYTYELGDMSVTGWACPSCGFRTVQVY
jgi:hypothetical protein